MRFLILFLGVILFADINQILYKIALKNDLSNKTKKENSGILYLFEREDINSLQITHLRDLFKLLPIGYRINRYGVVDPLNPDTNIPFLSSTIKVFINNQEIVSGFYNSGLPILGDIDLGWVDHIEVYTQAPSLDVSTEPSLILIKLYTKKASRDSGNNIHLEKGIKNSLIYFEKADSLKNYSYYAYISDNNQKSSYDNSIFSNQALLNIYNEDSSFLLEALTSKRGGLFGFSLDGDVDKSYLKNRYIHLGYNKKIGDFDFFSGFNIMKFHTYYYEEPILFIYKNMPIQKVDVVSFDRLFDIDLDYKKEFDKNIVLLGVKNRFKYFDWTKLKFNDRDFPQTRRDTQNVHTLFFQYSRFLKSNSLLNFGYAVSFFRNSADFKNQKTKQYRIAHTFVKDSKLTFKTVFSHIEYALDPFLINSIFLSKPLLKPVRINNILEDIKFKNLLHLFEFSIGYFYSHNYFFPNKDGLLDNLKKEINEFYAGIKYSYRYRPFSKFDVGYFFQRMNHIPKVNVYRIHKLTLYNYNEVKSFSFFEELVVDKNENSKFYYDLSLGAKYYKNDNLTFFVKGENLLNRGYSQKFFSFNPLTQKFNSPISVPVIERRVVGGLEYSF